MPADVASQQESDRDRGDGGGDRSERGGSRQKVAASSKSKDLSHVPCKFYKVGGCTAGASCPFSHSVLEPGQQKEICTWFIKGNCKFGHKCALAHVLPGQTMAMDRKNKKAAQTAAAASGGDRGKSGPRGGKKDAGAPGSGKLPLLAGGATAPTRMLNSSSTGSSKSGRAPISMPLKATVSPSAPAPALNDTDFASFATLDEMEGVQQNRADGASFKPTESATDTSKPSSDANRSAAAPVPLPPSAPRQTSTTSANDFGPIGSPPNYHAGQPTSPSRANGTTFSPGTSPRNIANMSTSPSRNGPLSAPGNQEHFISSSFSNRGGIAASLGSGLAMMGGRRGFDDTGANMGPNSFGGMLSGQLSSSVSQPSLMNGAGTGRGEYDISIEYDEFSGARRNATRGVDTAVEDEDLEDFLPSSLNDLLTPAERSRRMSRSNSGHPPPSGISQLSNAMASANLGGADSQQQGLPTGAAPNGNGNGMGHRYSRSVPAPTLLGDIKSIWSDTSVNPMPSSPHHRAAPSAAYSSGLGNGQSGVHPDEVGLSMSMSSAGGGGETPSSLGMMSPSNASAAFLPGLHRHYMDSKAKQAQQAQLGYGGISRGLMRGTSNPMYSNAAPGGGGAGPNNNNAMSGNYLQPLGGMGLPSSASNPSGLHTHIHGNQTTTYRTPTSPFDLTQTLHQPQPHTARPIPSNLAAQASKMDDQLLAPNMLSPGSRALQSHAPGQSLPQGLAAGYSRIHALPPLTNIASPTTGPGSYGIGTSPGGISAALGNNSEGPYGDWQAQQGNNIGSQGLSGSTQSNTGGFESMFSRLSYPATSTRVGGGPGGISGTAPPPGLSRNVNPARYNQPGPLSPLHGPVVTRDDDILFDLDQ